MADRPFLSRWSRLKQEARNQPPGQAGGRRGGAAPVLEEPSRPAALPPEAGDHGQAMPVRQPRPGQQRGQGSVTGDPSDLPEGVAEGVAEGLPDIDSLTAESDFTGFLRKDVPKALQRRALRKLWTSDPVLACLDGLNDYEEDFTDAATVVEGMKSSYQVGRGFLTDEELAENQSVYRASREARIEMAEEAASDVPPEAAPVQDSDERAETAKAAEAETTESEPLAGNKTEDAAAGETVPELDDADTAAPAAKSQVASEGKNKNDNHS